MSELCPKCNKKWNVNYGMCPKCDCPPWTSGNIVIDDGIHYQQVQYRGFTWFEWIPYEQFSDIVFIASGGFGSIEKAIWNAGPVTGINKETKTLERTKGKMAIALKTLFNSSECGKDIVNEIITTSLYRAGDGVCRAYGVSRHPSTKNYIIVLNYYENGALNKWLEKSKSSLDWEKQLLGLQQMVYGLSRIHRSGRVHRDLHSGNVLCRSADFFELTDLGRCKRVAEIPQGEEVFGIIPYVAPEVLSGEPYSTAADMYSLGMLMWEMWNCQYPFSEREHNTSLIHSICNCNIRPPITDDMPECYKKFMIRCWDKEKSARPTAEEAKETIEEWIKDENIRMEFSAANIKRRERLMLAEPSEDINVNWYKSRSLTKMINATKQLAIMPLLDENDQSEDLLDL